MVTKGYGFSIEDIDWSCPADLQPYDDAHQLEVQERDILAWEICGTYMISALTVAIEHIIAGNKAKSKYLKEPNTHIDMKSENKSKLSIDEEIDLAIVKMMCHASDLQAQGLPESPK